MGDMVIRRDLLVVAVAATLCSCVLPPWPLGDSSPGYEEFERDDDDVSSDDDDDDTSSDDDDTSSDDDDSVDPNDQDGDGWEADGDCDDDDPTVHPGAEEIHCDGVDNNCDEVEECNVCDGALFAVSSEISPGDTSYDGELSLASQVDAGYYFDVYRVVTQGTGWIDISLYSAEFRPYLELRAESCAVVASDSPTFTDLSWLLVGTQTGSVHYVVVSTADLADVGSYSLTFSLTGF